MATYLESQEPVQIVSIHLGKEGFPAESHHWWKPSFTRCFWRPFVPSAAGLLLVAVLRNATVDGVCGVTVVHFCKTQKGLNLERG